MHLISSTPFGQRPMTAGQIASQELARATAEVAQYDKWELFRELCVARHTFGLTDRDLAVLNALLSFHPGKTLKDEGDLIVYPSNRALSERAHGMAESTLRRHIAALVEAGVIARHDSPNGKRYVRRNGAGGAVLAFGFNLRPLLVRAVEIADAALEARNLAAELRGLREKCSLTLRDTAKLAEYEVEEAGAGQGAVGLRAVLSHADALRKVLRRKLSLSALATLYGEISGLREKLRGLLTKTEKMSASDVHSERQCQNSNKDPSDLEPCLEKAGGEVGSKTGDTRTDGESREPERAGKAPPLLPLPLVLKACPDILDYARDGIVDWRDFIATAEFVRGMMGVSPDAWEKAKLAMGAAEASIVLAAILQRVSEINAPGGYLRALTAKAEDGAFSPGPMIMALLNRSQGKVA